MDNPHGALIFLLANSTTAMVHERLSKLVCDVGLLSNLLLSHLKTIKILQLVTFEVLGNSVINH